MDGFIAVVGHTTVVGATKVHVDVCTSPHYVMLACIRVCANVLCVYVWVDVGLPSD